MEEEAVVEGTGQGTEEEGVLINIDVLCEKE
jgi:hypothetical protein